MTDPMKSLSSVPDSAVTRDAVEMGEMMSRLAAAGDSPFKLSSI